MTGKRSLVLLVAGLSSIAAISGAAGERMSPAEMTALLKELDGRRNVGGDWRGVAYLEEKEKGEITLAYEMEFYTRTAAKQFVLLFTKPKTAAGEGYLRVDRNLWYYDPAVGKWERRTERERIGDTGSRRSDLDESRLAEEYDPSYVGEERLGAFDTIVLLLKGKAGVDLAFPKMRIWIDQKSRNVLKVEGFAASGKLLRTAYYPAWKSVHSAAKNGLVWYPAESRLFDEVHKGTQTLILIKAVDLRPLPPNLFTKAWLESKSR